MRPFDSVTVLENSTGLDRVVDPVRGAVRGLLRRGPVADALHGVWLGHPVHPTVVQVAIGAFTSASLLDAVPGHERSARVLVAAGLASSAPAYVTGWADWSELHEQQQRVGVVHAALNVAGVAAYAASLAARVSGREGRGRTLGWTGLALLSVGGFLGGHLSFRQAAGANHAETVPHLVRPGWQDLCAVDDLGGEGEPTLQVLGEGADAVALLVVRRGDRIDVVSGRCSHLAGPLHEGEVDTVAGCVTCPWHGSEFSLTDGAVRRGPATAPLHAFDVRVEGGRLMVRLPGAG